MHKGVTALCPVPHSSIGFSGTYSMQRVAAQSVIGLTNLYVSIFETTGQMPSVHNQTVESVMKICGYTV